MIPIDEKYEFDDAKNIFQQYWIISGIFAGYSKTKG